MIDYTTLGLLPAVQPRTLVVKARPRERGGALPAALLDASPLTEAVPASGGLARLAQLDRSGGVRRIVAVGGPDDTAGALGPAGVLGADGGLRATGLAAGAASALSVLATQAMQETAAAASVVQLTADVDVDDLVSDLANDPEVDFAARLPARWLLAPAPVDAADLDRRLRALEARPAAAAPPVPWNLARIGLPEVEARGDDLAEGVRVAVLDTGVDEGHPSLAGAVVLYEHGDAGTGPVSAADVVGHGTHVAGTVHSLVDAVTGARGVCRAGVEVHKIFDDDPDLVARAGVFAYLVDPVMYRRSLAACAEGADVVNLSIGGTAPPDPQEAALFRVLLDRGVVVVAAMGNERAFGSPVSYPAAVPGVIAVGATTAADEVASFSNRGDHIALAAPGAGIWSTLPTYPGQMAFRATRDARGQLVPGAPLPRETRGAAMDGTSMASPHVAAAAALVQANSPQRRTPEEVRDLLMATAAKVPAMGGARWTPDLGSGRLDLRRLLFAAAHLPVS